MQGTFSSYGRNVNDLSALTNSKFTNFFFSSDSITNISSFNSISTLNNFRVDSCPQLVSITGFQNLENISSIFRLRWNDVISDLSGLQKLKYVFSTLEMYDGLYTDLDDFASLRVVGFLNIQNMPNLIDISFLNQMNFLGNIQLINNPELESCCIIKNMYEASIIGNYASIKNNKTNCNNLFQIYDSCEDSDNDGVEDSIDNCVDSPNTTQSDIDNDGIGDGCDNCPLVANEDQADADTNGIGDACDSGQGNVGVYNELGDLYNSSNISGLILKSVNGECYRIIVNDQGGLETHGVVCP